MGKFQDLTGNRYSRLVVLEVAGRTKSGSRLWACKCDCGKVTKVQANNLKTGTTKSCGCLREEYRRKAMFNARPRTERYTDRYANYVGIDEALDYLGSGDVTISQPWDDLLRGK